MEAQLIDTAARPIPVPARPPASLQTDLLLRIDRYLRAAGATDSRRRSRLIAATARHLLAQGATRGMTWAEVIAAVDRSLATEFALPEFTLPEFARPEFAANGVSLPPPGTGGRIALRHFAAGEAAADICHLPPRQRRPMPPQDLRPWRPGVGWLGHLKPHASAPVLAASLCCLAVLLLP